MLFIAPIETPPDGFTGLEKIFLRDMVIDFYKLIPNVKDKFIFLAVLEMGYNEDVVGKMLNKSQNNISARLTKIKERIRKHHLKQDKIC
jgi:hypothetical protein